jgi:hypothetical protein
MRGDGTVYKRGTRWWISYWRFGRNHRESGGRTEAEARRRLRRRLGEIATGQFVGPEQERVTVGHVLEAYLENRKLAGRCSPNITQRCAVLRDAFGVWRAAEVSLPRLETWANERLAAGAAHGTVKVDLAYLHAGFIDLCISNRHPPWRSCTVQVCDHKEAPRNWSAAGDARSTS